MRYASTAEQIAEKLVAYREEVHRLKAVLQLCPLPVMLAHHDGDVILYVNPAYTFFLGGTVENMQNGAWIDHWVKEDQEKMWVYWNSVVKNKTTQSTFGRYTFPADTSAKKARVTATVLESNGIICFVFPEICWDVPLPIQIVEPPHN